MKKNLITSALPPAALLIVAMVAGALAGCSNMVHELHSEEGTSYPSIALRPAIHSLVQGQNVTFTAELKGVYGNRGVTWELAGTPAGASIDSSGRLSAALSSEPGTVLSVQTRSVKRTYVTATIQVTVVPFIALAEVANGETVTVNFTNGGPAPLTGTVLNGGVVFDQDALPGGDWVIKDIVIGGITRVKIGRSSGSVADTPVSLAFAPGGGGGSYTLAQRPAVDGRIPIGSYDEFQLIRTDNFTFALRDHYKQEADLDLMGDASSQWTAIGDFSPPFTGTFDGNNKHIDNIYINKPGVNYQGLFGYAGSDSEIKNVHIRSGSVTGRNQTGGVVGAMVSGSVTGCSNRSTIRGGNQTGGVVGSSSNGVITGCSNEGDVEGTSQVGGVAGANTGISIGKGTITACSNSGPVTGTGQYVGGVAGANRLRGAITACYNTGEVSGSDKTGGVIGYNQYGTVTACYWQTGRGVDEGIGEMGTGTGSTSFFSSFFPPTGDAAWGTGNGSGPNKYWKAGVNYNTHLPKLWFE